MLIGGRLTEGYDGIVSREALRAFAFRDDLTRMIDAQLPRGLTILEAGCGSGRLTNFLAMSPWRRVIGGDPDETSLSLAEDFRRRFEINNALFVRMSLSSVPFRPASLEVIVAHEFLHRVPDPRLGFQQLAEKLRLGGLIIVTARCLQAGPLAAGVSRTTCSQEAVLGWFDENRIEFLSGIPHLDGHALDDGDDLFRAHSRASPLRRALSQLTLRLEARSDASFAMIGRRQS